MTSPEPPAWCHWRRGRSAVLVIAPHGGRRPPASHETPGRGGRRVNDLYTAELADELVDALGAACVVNRSLDRNQLDLNRISQVTARAAWFLALIEELLDDILAHHRRAEVLFVHGWNVIQPKCDIGVGHALTDAAAAVQHGEALTVSPGYAAERLAVLQSGCAAVGIATTFGQRYAARHPNNLLQLFRHGAVRPAPARLAAWTAERRVEAVQLELGVALRWPGAYRHAFVNAARAAFNGAGRTAPSRSAAARHPCADGRPGRRDDAAAMPGTLQLYDPRAAIGLTARVDRTAAHTAGRLLLFLGGERLALFLGEDPYGAGPAREGPHFTPEPDGVRLRFDGPALAADDGALFVDLEQGFAASRLCPVAVDLLFRPGLSPDYGAATGWIEVDARRCQIDTHAFARHGVLQGAASAWSSHLTLSAAFGPGRAVRVRHEFPGSGGTLHELTASGEVVSPLAGLNIRFDRDRNSPEQIRIGSDVALLCQPLSRMVITRPLPPHRQARVTFGTARFTYAGSEGFGFYEYGRAPV